MEPMPVKPADGGMVARVFDIGSGPGNNTCANAATNVRDES